MGFTRLGFYRLSPFARHCPHPREPPRRARRDRRGADHRRARRHLRRRQSGHARFRPVPHPVDLRPAYGDHGRHRVLADQGSARALPVDRVAVSDTQMGGGCRARCRLVLSPLVRRRGADRPFLDHDEHRAHRRAARSAGAHHAQRCACRSPHPHRVAREPVRS